MKTRNSGFLRFKGTIILNLIFLSVLLSCKKEDNEPLVNYQSLNEGITFHAGRLIFNDETSFMDHQKWLFENQSNPELIVDKNRSLGIKSMTEYYIEGMRLDEFDPSFKEYVAKYPNVFHKETYDNSTLYLLPHSKILCYVANKDGVFQIGDQIYRIAGNYIYQTGDESKIEMLFLPKDQISTNDVKISLSQPHLDSKNDYGNKTVPFTIDSDFRIVSSLREYTMGISWYDDIITNPQHRVLGVWGSAQLNTKSANDVGYKAYCPGCTQYPISAYYSDVTGLSQDVIAFGGSQINMSASYCPAYSRGRLIIDGVPEYVYIIWGDALAYPATATWTWTNDIDDPF